MRTTFPTLASAIFVLSGILSNLPDTYASLQSDTLYRDLQHVQLSRRGFEGINTADSGANQSHYYAELSKPAGGLWIWTNLARLTRVNLRNGQQHIPLPQVQNGSFTFDGQKTLMYCIPIICFLGSLLLTFIANCCAGCCLCTCRKQRLARRQRDPFTTRQRTVAGFMLFFVYFCWTAAVIGGMRGSEYFHRAMVILDETANRTFEDADGIVANFQVRLGDVFDTLDSGINNLTDRAANLIDVAPLQNISDQIIQLAANCTALDNKKNLLTLEASSIESFKNLLTAPATGLLSQLITNITIASNKMDDLSRNWQPVPGNSNYAYKWTRDPNAPEPDCSELNNQRGQVAGTEDAVSLVTNALSGIPELSDIAAEALSIGGDLPGRVKSIQTPALNDVKNQTKSELASIKADVSVTFDDIGQKSNEYQATANDWMLKIMKYELYRRIAFFVLFGLPAVILIFMTGGVGGRRPGLVKGCLCGSIPYTLLALFLTMLFVIISILFGEACTVAFDRSDGGQSPLVSFMGNMTGSSDMISKAFNARDACLQGTATIDVVQMFVTLPDVADSANQQIDSMNFSSALSSLDVDSIIGSMQDPSSASSNAGAAETQVNQYNLTAISTMKDAVVLLQQAIGLAIDQLQGNGTAGPDGYRVFVASDINTNYTADNAALDALAAEVVALRNQFLGFNSSLSVSLTTSTSIQNSYNTMKSTVITMVNISSTIASAFSTLKTNIGTYVNNQTQAINASIPDLKDTMRATVNTAQNIIYGDSSNCKEVAKDTVDIQMAVCDGLLTGLDAIWFGFFILGSVGAMSVPIFISAANMLADRDATKPKGDKKKGGKKGGKKDKKSKGKQAKGKGEDDVEAGQIKWTTPKAPNTDVRIEKSSRMDELESPRDRKTAEGPDGMYPSLSSLPPNYEESFSSPSHLEHREPNRSRAPSQRAYEFPVEDIQEMRPSWLGASLPPGDVEVMSPAFSPRHHHPNVPLPQSYVSNHGEYLEPAQPLIRHGSNASHGSRRASYVPHQPVYDHVVAQLSKRMSAQQFDYPENPHQEQYSHGSGHHSHYGSDEEEQYR
ncbi:uncharacterized protein SPPG_02555 [Spizellomyces punctatus DAOM BR117]|uniref:Plasma membrane fusion protein PRM1 n=1 Tax=Spizellomyces punctatus (strain DAOM BR117) TaxID=645134 RepID=A0A0L0HKQ7_SPIPD|nr:uncharacterized protein SPPG_02555 [Spizellomyces punctatus DAOM BR117]KND02051.1 hypothetical protein SPPG_02555 [Spizellomyces punctatus DAOM BR117]|eukprot:XP_016610090.1 hypothetical protein SPPG_02555 [Spizellomyces punctatus DAOM BR117]